jgi:eukaryotic-like serine/threonine-protein kinase
MIGKTISHYKILEKLGEGGMGVVYKAEDTKLERTVALKFLPRGLETHEPERARFLQEAKAAAALNHANICTIHDVIVEGDYQFIVMEYVDGKTLRQMVPVQKIQDAIDYALQIGEALQEAHSHGVVHRDIKTENIMVNSKSQIKVMDFGLAKLKGSLKLTKTSSTVGTLAYMSPEQIQGNEVDGRSDIFSFGVVLFEMLTGELPFRGDYEAAMVYSIVNEEPESVQTYRPGISSEVMHILNRSLEKNPEERYQYVHEMVIDLKRVKKESTHAPRPVRPQAAIELKPVFEGEDKTGLVTEKEIVPAKGRKTSWNRLVIVAILLCFVAVITAILLLKPFSHEPLPPMKIIPFANSPGHELTPSFSPDGNQIAYSWTRGEPMERHIYVKLIGTSSPLRLTENPGFDCDPVWSPDGRSIAFVRLVNGEPTIYKIPALGGTEQRLIKLNKPGLNMYTMFDWSPDGGLIIYSNKDSGDVINSIYTVSLSTMEKRRITLPPNGTLGDDEPAFSPDGRWIAFRRTLSYASTAIFIIPISGGLEKGITSDTQTILDLAWSQDGREIIFSSDRGGTFGLWRVPFKGGELKPVPLASDAMWFGISKKGQRLAYSKGSTGGGSEIILKGDMPEKEGQVVETNRLLATNQYTYLEQFSPDGLKIVFVSGMEGNDEIWICDRDGTNPVQLTDFGSGHHCGIPSWSPDSRDIVFEARPYGNGDIYIVNSESRQLRRITTETSDERDATWSRDERWIYFTSNRTGNYRIWKCPVNAGEAVQISPDESREGWHSLESQDGKWLFSMDFEKNKIWKYFLENRQKQLFLDNVLSFNWALSEDGMYYLQESLSTGESVMYFKNFATNNTKKLASIKLKNLWNFSISPDRRSFLVTEEQSEDYDIYLVENFQ